MTLLIYIGGNIKMLSYYRQCPWPDVHDIYKLWCSLTDRQRYVVSNINSTNSVPVEIMDHLQSKDYDMIRNFISEHFYEFTLLCKQTWMLNKSLLWISYAVFNRGTRLYDVECCADNYVYWFIKDERSISYTSYGLSVSEATMNMFRLS
jgi:hypothetical protein